MWDMELLDHTPACSQAAIFEIIQHIRTIFGIGIKIAACFQLVTMNYSSWQLRPVPFKCGARWKGHSKCDGMTDILHKHRSDTQRTYSNSKGVKTHHIQKKYSKIIFKSSQSIFFKRNYFNCFIMTDPFTNDSSWCDY